jgi:hypothetical protein
MAMWWQGLDIRTLVVTIDLLLKLLTLAPALEKDAETVVAEIKSDDTAKQKMLALIGDLENLLAQLKTLLQ